MKPADPPLCEQDVLRVVYRVVITKQGSIFPSKHFNIDSMPGRNLDMSDALKVLAEATTVRVVVNTNWNTWNYDLPGTAIDGSELIIRIAIESNDELILVTAF